MGNGLITIKSIRNFVSEVSSFFSSAVFRDEVEFRVRGGDSSVTALETRLRANDTLSLLLC